MDIEKQRSTLAGHGVDLQKDTFIAKNSRGEHILIVTRVGCDRIEAHLNIEFEFRFVSEAAYKDGVNVTVVMRGTRPALYDGPQLLSDARWVEALGSANPDTMKGTAFKYYGDTAARRSKHKITLKLAGLYQHGVHSEDESDDFKRPKRNDVASAVAEATSKIKA